MRGYRLSGEDMRHAPVGERTAYKSAVPKISLAGRAFGEILVKETSYKRENGGAVNRFTA